VSIKFSQPISTAQLGTAPFNPFIIINKDRSKEVHLPYRSLTDLGSGESFVEGHNADPDGNFISDRGYPWAISVIHDFKVPKERVSVEAAYNYFRQWAESGGVNYSDWYKDNPGYRNSSQLGN
jgi:LruC domain-containing protein